MFLVVAGVALFGIPFQHLVNAEIGVSISQSLPYVFILMISSLMIIAGMTINHSENKMENVTPTVLGLVLSLFIAVTLLK